MGIKSMAEEVCSREDRSRIAENLKLIRELKRKAKHLLKASERSKQYWIAEHTSEVLKSIEIREEQLMRLKKKCR